MNPFQEHADNTAAYQDMLKGDDGSGGATLTLKLSPDVTFDCTFESIIDDFNLIAGGQSPKLMINGCKFLADGVPSEKRALVRKGLRCSLLPNPAADPIDCQLWAGGLEQGGLIYSFVLVTTNYSA